MADEGLGGLWRRIAAVARHEAKAQAAAYDALRHVLDYAATTLRSSRYDPAALSSVASGWRESSSLAQLLDQVEAQFILGWDRTARGDIDPDPYALRHIEATTNRLAGVPDEVFDSMRGQIAEARLAQESIPQIAARIDAMLGDDQRWKNRATLIARTESLTAARAGSHGSAGATADLLGIEHGDVAKRWMATSDDRTRPEHADADGQIVLGLDAEFDVDGGVVFPDAPNCRCDVIYVYPGDPDYPGPDAAVTPLRATEAPTLAPTDLVVDPGPQTAAETVARTMTAEELAMETKTRGGMPQRAAKAELARRGLTAAADDEETRTGVVVVALPAADDPAHGIGPEDKHCTLLYFGDVPGGDNPNGLLTPEFRTVLESAIATAAAAQDPTRTAQVQAVESLGAEGARVWMLDGPPMTDLRAGVQDTGVDVSTALAGVEQFPTYTPHVTIGYADVESVDAAPSEDVTVEGLLDPATEEAAAAITSITFDRLALWWAGEHVEWTLGGPAEEAPVTDTPPTQEQVAAALAVLARMHYGNVTQADFARTQAADLPEDQPAAAEGTPALAQDIASDGEPFHGILWPEATLSGDGRQVEANATVWRDLPLPLMAQDAQAMGHDGAVRVGRIDTIERDATTYAVPVLRYTGVWDTSEVALETARQVGAGVARGVSVDGDDVTVELRGSDGQPLDPMVDDFPEDGVVVESATAARVAGATVCSIPAFQQAYVANGTYTPGQREPGWNSDGTPLTSGQVPEGSTPVEGDAEDPQVVMASAWSLVAAAGPVWATTDFANPGLTEPTRLTVTDDGRVFGHLATWGVCHIGIDGVCQEPPVSATNYAYFATGAVQTDAGLASVGQLTMETGHAPMRAGHRAAAAHYDNTGSAVADVAMGQDAVGIWFSGRLRPGTTPEQVYAMRAAGSVSGDWREVGGQLELVAALVVNCPGFPVPAPAVAASGGRPVAMVASGVVRPAQGRDRVQVQSYAGDTVVDAWNGTTLTEAVETVLAARELRARATTASARLRSHRLTSVTRRLAADKTRRATAALARITEG